MRVFILGAGLMQVPAIRIARELGWKVAAADGNPEALGGALADRFFAIDLKDGAGLLAAAREFASDGGLDAVFTAGTDFSAQVAALAEALGLPGHSLAAARAASDKLLMRAAFEAAGLPSPRFLALTAADDPLAAALRLGLPLVVKPADNMGARGCRLARNETELRAAWAAALPYSRTGRGIVEEYVEGPEFSVDAIVEDGQVRIRGLADRHIYFEPYFVELGHTMPSAAPEAVQREVLAVFEAGVRALGLSRGAAKGDIKWSIARGGAVIGEIAARLSGGYMSGWTYPYASGIEPTREALELAAGLCPSPGPADRAWFSAERAFISIPGRALSLHGLRDAENAPYIKNLFLRVEPGQELRFPCNNIEKCGNLISQAPNREAAMVAADSAAGSILIRLEPRHPATEAFLRGEGRILGPGGQSWPPEAFALSPEWTAALEGLSERRSGVDRGLLVAPLDWAAAVETRDWSGRAFLASAEEAMSRAGARLASDGEAALAGAFWRALARGGVQAALYVLDCEAEKPGRHEEAS